MQQAQAAAAREGFYETVGLDPASFENARLNTLEATIGQYALEVIEAAQANLDAEDKVSSGNLASSFELKKVGSGKKFAIEVWAADYLKFVDLGVQGYDATKNINTTSPFRYKREGKPIPVNVIEKWIIRNRLSASAKDVKKYGGIKKERKAIASNISRRTLAFMIGRSIKKKGLERTGFWTKAWDATFKDFNEQIAKAVGSDIQITLQTMNKLVNGNNS